ncbi:unnamed protein product [Microthlaspi erraticum]|uniref:Uncharacterized protein n=1 Tax=Microthlaspi erraticum TaxID=1685480 RepID=A0A6D2IZ99_9BRAS|nr:unnamed protein product [Microthlaspi erraticum]
MVPTVLLRTELLNHHFTLPELPDRALSLSHHQATPSHPPEPPDPPDPPDLRPFVLLSFSVSKIFTHPPPPISALALPSLMLANVTEFHCTDLSRFTTDVRSLAVFIFCSGELPGISLLFNALFSISGCSSPWNWFCYPCPDLLHTGVWCINDASIFPADLRSIELLFHPLPPSSTVASATTGLILGYGTPTPPDDKPKSSHFIDSPARVSSVAQHQKIKLPSCSSPPNNPIGGMYPNSRFGFCSNTTPTFNGILSIVFCFESYSPGLNPLATQHHLPLKRRHFHDFVEGSTQFQSVYGQIYRITCRKFVSSCRLHSRLRFAAANQGNQQGDLHNRAPHDSPRHPGFITCM